MLEFLPKSTKMRISSIHIKRSGLLSFCLSVGKFFFRPIALELQNRTGYHDQNNPLSYLLVTVLLGTNISLANALDLTNPKILGL
ncbi:uncharacterized protein F4822DRAFT_328458 [Hypoxylon trugodes]|uniref:uncharacterized protein n=1 Tax=Hypoxylon trugodes TaxID=326681 RepID=UPI002192FDF8|nr:uncharacterized protein F4822DRAFT_328458 [Hypoxylon trugodes]KAI1386864.1 hypothetical protein F4822DRAFT_328458 [Hypoxylon trugodes]